MHSKLRNLNFPDHLKWESHWKCKTRCSSGVNRYGSLVIRELCKYPSAKDADHNFFFFFKAFRNQRKHERAARSTLDEQEQDDSADAPHFYCPIQPNLSVRIYSCKKIPARSLMFRLLAQKTPFVTWKNWISHCGGSGGIFCSSACVSYTPPCLGLISSWSSLKTWEKWQWVALQEFSWSSEALQVRVALVY